MTLFSSAAVRADFSRAAESYDHAAYLQRRVLQQAIDRLSPHIAPRARLLDAGCGTGALRILAPGWNLTGVDLAEGMCRKARSVGMQAAQADLARLPFAGDTFDAAVCSLVLQWVNEPEKIFREFHRVLTQGGYGIITSFGPRTLSELRAVAGDERISRFRELLLYVKAAHEAGFTVSASEEVFHESHPDLASLMQNLRAIGAVNKQESRPRGLTTRRFFTQVETRYRERFGAALPVTWQIYYLLLRKR